MGVGGWVREEGGCVHDLASSLLVAPGVSPHGCHDCNREGKLVARCLMRLKYNDFIAVILPEARQIHVPVGN